ncbi:hypothetical protein TYRP_001765 [Tyrophagus putrescentiae]|nr:hypothetical protein TYRP_001765 [Tyrophagus putrescentiae]
MSSGQLCPSAFSSTHRWQQPHSVTLRSSTLPLPRQLISGQLPAVLQSFASLIVVVLKKPQMLKACVIWLIGTDGSGHNELANCVPSRRTMPINQMTPLSKVKQKPFVFEVEWSAKVVKKVEVSTVLNSPHSMTEPTCPSFGFARFSNFGNPAESAATTTAASARVNIENQRMPMH